MIYMSYVKCVRLYDKYMITKKHDTINLITYNIIFIRLRLLRETISSTANPHVFFKAILQRHSTQQP